jgi:hypothetical protein
MGSGGPTAGRVHFCTRGGFTWFAVQLRTPTVRFCTVVATAWRRMQKCTGRNVISAVFRASALTFGT